MAPVTYEYVLTLVCTISVCFALCVSLVLRIVRLTLMVSDVVNVRIYRYSMKFHIEPYALCLCWCLHMFKFILIHVSISSFLVSALSIAIVLVTSYFSFLLFIAFHHDMICNIYSICQYSSSLNMASVSLLSRDVCISHVKTQRLPGYMIRHFQPMSLVLGSNGIDVGSLAEYVDIFQI